jgi:hypothetical protein
LPRSENTRLVSLATVSPLVLAVVVGEPGDVEAEVADGQLADLPGADV